MRIARFEIYKGTGGTHRWRFLSVGSKVVAEMPAHESGYKTPELARTAARRAATAMALEPRVFHLNCPS